MTGHERKERAFHGFIRLYHRIQEPLSDYDREDVLECLLFDTRRTRGTAGREFVKAVSTFVEVDRTGSSLDAVRGRFIAFGEVVGFEPSSFELIARDG
jgi:hypothetical protein